MSPGWISVPTPLIWSTWTLIARRPGSSSVVTWAAAAEALNVAELMMAPVATCVRAVWPITARRS